MKTRKHCRNRWGQWGQWGHTSVYAVSRVLTTFFDARDIGDKFSAAGVVVAPP
jgi:hypothetical protein